MSCLNLSVLVSYWVMTEKKNSAEKRKEDVNRITKKSIPTKFLNSVCLVRQIKKLLNSSLSQNRQSIVGKRNTLNFLSP